MKDAEARRTLAALLAKADIGLDGRRPWDVAVRDPRFYARVAAGGSLAAGDAYMDGWWDVARLDEFFARLLAAGLYPAFTGPRARWRELAAHLWNRRNPRRAAEARDGLGNALFRVMLGKRLSYTCAYWDGARGLDEADEAKLELVCRKLALRPGHRVLELGCGWGAFAKYAAERYRVSVVGLNISKEQVSLGAELCHGLDVELRLADYREAEGTFDRVVSLGIMEHVGPGNHRLYMETAARCLEPDGLAFIHPVGANASLDRCDPWFDARVFPDGAAPSLAQLARAAEGLFVVEDVENIGPHYDRTLMARHENLLRGWQALSDRHGERTLRMLRYCLLASAGSFRARASQVYQLVLTKPGRAQPACRVPRRVAAAA